MSYGWDALPETDLTTDPDARDPQRVRSVLQAKKMARDHSARLAARSRFCGQMGRINRTRADAALRKFGGE